MTGSGTSSAAPPRYREHAPHTHLARHVECYWSVHARLAQDEVAEHRVLPDGCMDVLFVLGDPPRAGAPGGVAPVAVGTMTRPLDVEYAGRVHIVGVRFRPGAALPYLGAPAPELTDDVAPLEALWGATALDLRDRLALATRDVDRVALLDAELLRRARDAASGFDEGMLRASEVATRTRGGASVDELARAAGTGRRQLERRFLAAVGIPPKTACRVARFRAAVARLHAEPAVELSQVAFDAGYADQPHFTREFRALAGVTPGAYRREVSGGRGSG